MDCGFIKVAAATTHVRVADTQYNTERIIECMRKASEKKVKILVTPELSLTGATCEDLFLQDVLLKSAEESLGIIAEASEGLDLLVSVGLPVELDGSVYNCAAVLYDGEILGVVPKTNLLNYGGLFEKRWFESGADVAVSEITIAGQDTLFGTELLFRNETLGELCVAVEIGSDLQAVIPPSAYHVKAGANVILNPAACAATADSGELRRDFVKNQSMRLACGYISAGAGGGESTQDNVYTGHNMIFENGVMLNECDGVTGMITTELDVSLLQFVRRKTGAMRGDSGEYAVSYWDSAFEETNLTREISKEPFIPQNTDELAKKCEKIIDIQSRGLKKRLEHTNAKTLVIGLSGGLDSTLAILVCAKALDMLGRPREDILAITMPCFGTTARTRSNAEILAEELGAQLKVVDITNSVKSHFADIGQAEDRYDVVFENSQARERTQVLMDVANGCGGLVIGTGDLSELALGWATYNGDHMSMYGVNGGVPKTLVRKLVQHVADTCENEALKKVLYGILNTPVSPELLPAENGEISQKTEDLVGPYELHDFFMYNIVHCGFEPKKVYRLAKYAFDGEYDGETVIKWLKTFIRRFFNQQFKRSCLPDGPQVGVITLSPRAGWKMPSDAVSAAWLEQLEDL